MTVRERFRRALCFEPVDRLPMMARDGFIASVDHQTSPNVTLDQYRGYLALYREYAERAAQLWEAPLGKDGGA